MKFKDSGWSQASQQEGGICWLLDVKWVAAQLCEGVSALLAWRHHVASVTTLHIGSKKDLVGKYEWVIDKPTTGIERSNSYYNPFRPW